METRPAAKTPAEPSAIVKVELSEEERARALARQQERVGKPETEPEVDAPPGVAPEDEPGREAAETAVDTADAEEGS